MKRTKEIGIIETEFIYKCGMNERLIEAYQITVKTPGHQEKSYDQYRERGRYPEE